MGFLSDGKTIAASEWKKEGEKGERVKRHSLIMRCLAKWAFASITSPRRLIQFFILGSFVVRLEKITLVSYCDLIRVGQNAYSERAAATKLVSMGIWFREFSANLNMFSVATKRQARWVWHAMVTERARDAVNCWVSMFNVRHRCLIKLINMAACVRRLNVEESMTTQFNRNTDGGVDALFKN